jgi:hypothetical protein
MTAERPSERLLPFCLFDDEADVAVVQRKLPHWSQPGTVAFITWRTLDSMVGKSPLGKIGRQNDPLANLRGSALGGSDRSRFIGREKESPIHPAIEKPPSTAGFLEPFLKCHESALARWRWGEVASRREEMRARLSRAMLWCLYI